MARTVEDVSVGFSIVAGPHWSDPLSVPAPVDDPASVTVGALRVAVVEQIGPEVATPETLAALRRAAEAFESAGADVQAVDSVPGDDRIHELAVAGLDPTSGAATEARLIRMGGSLAELHPLTRLTYDTLAEPTWTIAEYQELLTEVFVLRARVRRFFERHDVLLSPVAAEPAAPHGEAWSRLRGVDYCRWHNVTGVPAATVRAGTSTEGLPINVQAASRPFAEHICLAAARLIEGVTGGWSPPPQLRD
jgi:amidase